jgi:hypothetical protein
MKILIIDSFEFLTKDDKINGIFTFDQAKILNQKKYDVDILSPGVFSVKDLFKKKIYKKYEKIDGINIYRYYEKNIIPFSFSFLNFLIAKRVSNISIKLFEEYLKENPKPDLIHAHKIRFSLFAAHAIYLKYNIPFVITEHNSDIILNKFPITLKNYTKNIIKVSKNFNTVSTLASKKIKNFFNLKKIKVLRNVIPDTFYNGSNKIIKKNKSYCFLSVSRFDNNKNIKMLIDVFIENFNDKNAILNIVGGGKLIDNFRNHIYKKNFQNKIKLYNFVSRKKVSIQYQNCDCFVLPSHKETFGLALFEALLFKKHFITSRHSGYYELKNMNIKIPNFNSKDDIKLKKLMLNAYYYRKNFDYRDKILRNFGKKRFLETINKIYR